MWRDTANRSIWLQHPLNPITHFDFRLTRCWEHRINGHMVRIEKTRPLFLAGVRNQRYRVFVDGALVANTEGM